ncbi:MAG TPA: nuclear transport factor 2 family protein [Thermomicrobiales bacterium]|nr:nuclear transport factor 2 family protein [Thermomicrobiales bacterium]
MLVVALAIGQPLARGAPPTPPTTTGQAALARGFYAALNTMLAGGDGAPLTALVAPDVVVHLPNQRFVGSAPLLAYSAALGGASPGLRLELEALLVDGDQVATTVDPIVPTSAVPVDTLSRPALPGNAQERFRLAHGRVAEYWSDLAADDLPRSLPPLTVRLWPGAKEAGLARFTFPPGAELAELVAPDPHLLLVETGDLTVALVGQAQLVRGDDIRAGWQPTGTAPLVLRPGDALYIPAGVTHTLLNATANGASLLGVLLYGPDELAAMRQPTPDRVSRLLTMYATGLVAAPDVWTGGATVELLAQADNCGPAQAAALTVRWLPLAPEQRLAAHPVAGVELLAIETGAVLLGASRNSGMRLGRVSGADAALNQDADAAVMPDVIMGGDGIALSSGISAPIANAGRAPVRVILVTVAPSPTAPPTLCGPGTG